MISGAAAYDYWTPLVVSAALRCLLCVSVWSAVSGNCSILDRMEWVFADADLVPLLVQENYPNYIPDLVSNMPPHAVRALCCTDQSMFAEQALP